MNGLAVLELCDRNPLRTPAPARTWTIYRYERASDGELDRTPTGHEFTDYRAAEAYAEGLCNSTQVWERFWFEAEEADDDEVAA
jgi:hypothetical protein